MVVPALIHFSLNADGARVSEMKKMDEENVPGVFFNLAPQDASMNATD
jgi:hypothetical protein